MNTKQKTPIAAFAMLAAGLTIAPIHLALAAPQEASAGKKASARRESVPEEMAGTWKWTTISSVNYQDTVTKQLAEPSGMSARFTFLPNGRYKSFFYVRQRTYSLVTEATTIEEGTVSFNQDGTFRLTPSKGHYKGNTGSRLIDRDMTAAERKPHVYHYEWREGDSGKKQLYIGPSAESLSPFKRDEAG